MSAVADGPWYFKEDAGPDDGGSNGRSSRHHGLPIEYFNEVKPALDARDFVEGLLEDGAMSVVYGQSNSGKTFFMFDLACCVATGTPWGPESDRRQVTQGGVLWLAMEGGHGIRNRIAAYRQHHGLTEEDVPFAVVPVALNLLDPDADTDRVIQAAQQAAEGMGFPVRLIVVDTLSRAMAGGNENAPDDMGALVTNGTKLQQSIKAHVTWIHHSGKDDAKGARGHSLLRAATDTEIEITADGAARCGRVTKQREMECSGEFAFSLKVVELGINRRGKPVTSCVVVHGDISLSPMETGRRVPDGRPGVCYRILCDLVAQCGENGHPGAPDGVLTVPEDWWRERFYDRALPGADRKTREKAFRRAADALIEHRAVACSSGRAWLG